MRFRIGKPLEAGGPLRYLPLLLTMALGPSAHATELVWDGFYRARARYFDTLSLSSDNSNAQGVSFWLDHRMRLQPGWLLNDAIAIRAQLDLLDGVYWGQQAVMPVNPITGVDLGTQFTQTLEPPTTSSGGVTLQNLKVTRIWAEINVGPGQLRFGRMPLEWGSGMVFNAGNGPLDEYGNTVDRLQYAAKAGDVYVLGAIEQLYEGYVNQRDDIFGADGAVYYRTEQASLGIYNMVRWQKQGQSAFTMYTGSLWGYAEAGPVDVEAEFAANLGGGDLDTGANDVRISSFGGMFDSGYEGAHLRLGLGAGFATGDASPTDSAFHTFSFNPDFHVALMMFEEPMPTLAAAVPNSTNQGLELGAVRTGDGVRNALYLRPRIGWRLFDDLKGDLVIFTAQAAKQASDSTTGKGYGTELDADIHYTPIDRLDLHGTVGVFFPGRYFTEYEDPDLGSHFDRPALGGRVVGTIHF